MFINAQKRKVNLLVSCSNFNSSVHLLVTTESIDQEAMISIGQCMLTTRTECFEYFLYAVSTVQNCLKQHSSYYIFSLHARNYNTFHIRAETQFSSKQVCKF